MNEDRSSQIAAPDPNDSTDRSPLRPRDERPPQIRPDHLRRRAVIYCLYGNVSQAPGSELSNPFAQYVKPIALEWGWPETAIDVILEYWALRKTSGEQQTGWHRLLAAVASGNTGIAFVRRVAERFHHTSTLIDLCLLNDVLLVFEDHLVDFGVSSRHESYVTPERWKRIQAQLHRNRLPGPVRCDRARLADEYFVSERSDP